MTTQIPTTHSHPFVTSPAGLPAHVLADADSLLAHCRRAVASAGPYYTVRVLLPDGGTATCYAGRILSAHRALPYRGYVSCHQEVGPGRVRVDEFQVHQLRIA